MFYADFADQCDRQPNGKIVLGPTVSPEHHGWTPQFARNRDCAFDIAMVRYTLAAAIEGAGILGRDAPLVARWKQTLDRLPDYPTTGGAAPVVVDVAGAAPMTYNITVPTTPVFPGDVVTWWSPESEKELFARTLAGCRWNGNNSIYILSVGRARLSMPGTADWLSREAAGPDAPQSTDHAQPPGPPLQQLRPLHRTIRRFDGHRRVAAAKRRRHHPRLPGLAEGQGCEFTNLRAQGGFLVTAEQKAGKITKLEITSTVGGKLRLLNPWTNKSSNAKPSPVRN